MMSFPLPKQQRSSAFYCSIVWVISLLAAVNISSALYLFEEDRVNEYHNRNSTWPPRNDEYQPNTDGWRKLFQRRFRQVDSLTSDENSYNGYINSIAGGLMTPNYTEFGWGLTRAPEEMWNQLNEIIVNGLEDPTLLHQEAPDDGIGTLDNERFRPHLLHLDGLNNKILHSLQPILESWSGVSLIPTVAYGLRVYQNTSQLYMHTDRMSTHVISAIFHVGHDSSSKPWPLVIEDFHGNTMEVFMEAGDVLMYESSKCLHGRPRPFDGEWYTSLFVHYYPTLLQAEEMELDTHYRVPPHWMESVITSPEEDDFEIVSTFIRELNCPDEWCALENSQKLHGPAPGYGKVLTAFGRVEELDVPSEETLMEHAVWFEDEDSEEKEL
jgi:hypothetical protein